MKHAVKYPRTPHLPWSPGATSDDVFADGLDNFIGKEVVVTEKMDGENTSLYFDGMHARSIDGRSHPSRDWLKRWHSTIAHELPMGWRFCGENVYAKHSIGYESLEHYFFLFSVWDSENRCLSWSDTVEWAEMLGCAVPEVLYVGQWDRKAIESLVVDEKVQEGYVVRLHEGFAFADFATSIAKWVRPNHVQTDQHWMQAAIVPNELKGME
ncbi:hypothetical protein Rhal01_01797 [Rubritalea halochordaticola]|uniref:RNA ligase domain-containing protein n=1 Tax=Rubritalea halochordaticola TaxID=714537 RepID=A0ABP9UYU9_9BACT